MNIRDIRQEEWKNIYIEQNKSGILYVCPRAGKTKCGISIIKELFNFQATILIVYNEKPVKLAWEKEISKWNYSNPNITFTSYTSLKKYVDKIFDFCVFDEVHNTSEMERVSIKKILQNNKALGLTGTLSRDSEIELRAIGLPVIHRYPYKQAVEEGIISNYEIRIVKCKLDDKISIKSVSKGKITYKTEKRKFDNLCWVIDKLKEEEKDITFLALKRMRIIQNSLGKINKTKEVIKKLDGKVLIFTGLTKIADCLNTESYHAKKTDEEMLEDFCSENSTIPALSVCKLLNTGVTVNNLNYIVVNYTSSNSEDLAQKISRMLCYDMKNPEKKAICYIITTDEEVELKWIKSGLSMLDPEKIIWDFKI